MAGVRKLVSLFRSLSEGARADMVDRRLGVDVGVERCHFVPTRIAFFEFWLKRGQMFGLLFCNSFVDSLLGHGLHQLYELRFANVHQRDFLEEIDHCTVLRIVALPNNCSSQIVGAVVALRNDFFGLSEQIAIVELALLEYLQHLAPLREF